MISLLKFSAILGLMILFILHACFWCLLSRDEFSHRHKISPLLQRYSRVALRILGVHTIKKNDVYKNLRALGGDESDQVDAENKSYMIVANHLSTVDILILASMFPCAFVTSVEVRNTPFIGWMCRSAGCLFVERRSRTKIHTEINKISNVMNNGQNVVVFPEGTTTNGDSILPFKTGLFNAAMHSGKPLLPVCLRYLTIDGLPIDCDNRDRVFYYGEMGFIKHIWELAKARSILSVATVCDPVFTHGSFDRFSLGKKVYKSINEIYHSPFKITPYIC